MKNYRNGFDIASQVSKRREGDCTEHAVLATALARANGVPSRIVLGLLVAFEGGALRAFGHAWAEAHVQGSWQIADATQPEQAGLDGPLFYLPVQVLEQEGAGYSMQLMEFAMLRPSSVVRAAMPAVAAEL